MKKLVIFDLDGTLLDTVADLAQSTNYALRKSGFPVHPTLSYKQYVGNGINKLFERALPEGERTEKNILMIRELFLTHYNLHNTDKSTSYPGIPELLEVLHQKKILLAVASNKYQQATEKLVRHYFSSTPFVRILGQREGIPAKPDPAIVDEILHTTPVAREEVLLVGDSGVDMQTARNSRVTACGVTWGFRSQTELEEYQPGYIVHHASEIPEIVNNAI